MLRFTYQFNLGIVKWLRRSGAEVRKDAVAFSDAEEAFFRAGSERPSTPKIEITAPVETFDDLDADYKPVGFWDRLRGKKRARTSPPVPKKKL